MRRKDMLFDVRSLKYRLRRGEVSQEQYDKILKDLPDDAEEAEETETRFTTPWLDRLDAEDAASDR